MILVTGATGHIGNVLIRQLLDKGEKVRALVWKGEDTTSIRDLQIETIEGDVLDLRSLKPAFKGVDVVYHLAGVISIMPGHNPFVWDVNVQGTRNVLQIARQEGIRRLVYTSSIHAIARAPHGVQIDESLPFDINNPYGAYDRSKAEASLEVQEASLAGLDAVIVCPTGVIGPYDFRRSEMGNVILDAALRKTTLYVDGAYDFVDVRDVADGLIKASEHGRKGENYILSGQKISVRYLLETVREVTGYAFPKFKIPFRLAEIASHFTPAFYIWRKTKPKFTPYSLEVLQSNSDISHVKASRELGYTPRPIYASITDTVRWFLENYILLFAKKGT
ncbi:MAG: epimerase [Chloroflexi bacterium GWB2_49_20]|nr:MAG: epimerase [Chloroflexi bacterium GWB2_49_20]OGN79303.1 MAG: epimerase [Chloroflexi bacterium GWC2_49_37]OGN82927.1 MAG: epimerase [Chloroflexi bacterium GWD2_49_16]HCC78580.1 epimerase [Anaerolineae bacterium]